MKKIITIILCLVVLASLTLPAFATTATTTELDVSFTPERALTMLPKMGVGMLVIFIVIGLIIATTILVGKLFSKKD